MTVALPSTGLAAAAGAPPARTVAEQARRLRRRIRTVQSELEDASERARALMASTATIEQTEPFQPTFKKLNEVQKATIADLVKAHMNGGNKGTIRLALRSAGRKWNRRGLAAIHTHAASVADSLGDLDLQERLLEEAMQIEGSAGVLRALIRHYNRRGKLDQAVALAAQLKAGEGPGLQPRSAALIRLVQDKHAFWTESGAFLDRLSEFRHGASHSGTRKMLYIVHNTLPYASGGYATRTHGILRGVKNAGYEVLAISRPGYPLDAMSGLSPETIPTQDEVEGVPYRRVLATSRKGLNQNEYIQAAAECLEIEFARERPAVVQAASNYQTGAPALIAARRLGIPFVYEVRGFWEITRASREPAFADTSEYEAMSRLEAETAARADAVITLTSAMKEELVHRGVDESRILLVHNSVDPGRFSPAPRDEQLATRLGIPDGVRIIGYVGSHVEYEGLDLLVEAVARLSRDGLDFRLLLVGDGSVTNDVLQLAAARGVREKLLFAGRVPHHEVEAYYSLIDVCPFPRKPWPVCELVSPMKPFEAMATGKLVIVSDTEALAEIVAHGQTGLHFRKGDIDDLAQKLALSITDQSLRERLGAAGRAWVLEHRTWDGAGRTITNLFDQLTAGRSAGCPVAARRG